MDGGGLNDIWVTPRGLRGEHCSQNSKYHRPVGAGGAGGVIASSDFGRSLNPISNGGEGYAYDITTCPSRFLDLPMALYQASE